MLLLGLTADVKHKSRLLLRPIRAQSPHRGFGSLAVRPARGRHVEHWRSQAQPVYGYETLPITITHNGKPQDFDFLISDDSTRLVTWIR